MLIADYTGSLNERMKVLNLLLKEKNDLILVGSSFGGLMASIFTCDHVEKVKKLILLAPALNYPEFSACSNRRIHTPVIIYHGKHDAVVPPEPVLAIAKKAFIHIRYHCVEDDHALHDTFMSLDWNRLLT